MNNQRPHGPSTLCVHAGTYHDPATGGACSPIFASTAFAFPNPQMANVYPRYFNTPNQQVINRKVAALEGGEDALTFGSGMAAIATLFFALLKPGDHVVFQGNLYGGTVKLIHEDLCRMGVAVSWAQTPDAFTAAIQPTTRLLYIETPSNPTLRCLDLAAIGRIGRDRGILTAIDNTFATPINQNPLAFGMDVVVHSATKYLNGHSDLNAGVVVSTRDVIARLLKCALNLGGMLDTLACTQLERGLKTLDLRVRQHNANALAVAQFLETHPAIARVHYPGLKSHPDHAIAKNQMRGFGGMLSFELKDESRVDAFLEKLQIITPALSLGGVESLTCVPSRTSHRTMSPEERHKAGIRDGLIRLSVGIENLEDLTEDLGEALEVAKNTDI